MSTTPKEKILGIDLGTTNSAAAGESNKKASGGV